MLVWHLFAKYFFLHTKQGFLRFSPVLDIYVLYQGV